MLDRERVNFIIGKVKIKLKQSKLEEDDFDIIVKYILSNLDKPLNLRKYLESFSKRNKLAPSEKKKLILKLKEGLDNTPIKRDTEKILEDQGLL